MEIIKTNCPECLSPLEFPRDFDNVICSGCGTAFRVRRYKETFSLAAIESESVSTPAMSLAQSDADDLQVIESRLTELDELIAEGNDEVEEMKSREQSAPLQLGCAFFGLLMLAISVIIAFMLLARSYVGHWLFYLALALAILLGLARIRQKLSRSSQLDDMRRERARLENGLAQLEAERERILQLKAVLVADESKHSGDRNNI
jgi:hypothetical protein